MIRPVEKTDAASLAAIYNHYISNTYITFEEEEVYDAEMASRVEAGEGLPWLVFQEGDEIIGYACASKWKSRCAYRFSAETTVYLKPSCTNRGIGRQLYTQLIAILRDAGFSTASSAALRCQTSGASQRLHEALGFKKVAHFEQVGWKFNKWIDVGYWELIFPPTK